MEKKIVDEPDVQQDHMSMSKVVADVLADHTTKRNKFLKNVGIHDVQSRITIRNLQEQLEEEKRVNSKLRSVVNTQRDHIEVLSEQANEAEQARVKDKEEMQKRRVETDAKLDLFLCQLGRRT
jgi:LmbE family N-acetylglucosaminyl deacetylase